MYSTCTLHHKENEGVALAFESKFGSSNSDISDSRLCFARSPLVEGLGEEVAERIFSRKKDECSTTTDSNSNSHEVRLTPHEHQTDGFFIARWRRIS